MTSPWRIVLADGRVLEPELEGCSVRARPQGAWTVHDGHCYEGGGATIAEAVLDLALDLVTLGIPVAAVLAPGQPTPAEAIAQERARLIAQVEDMRVRFECLTCGGDVVDRIAAALRGDPDPEPDVPIPF